MVSKARRKRAEEISNDQSASPCTYISVDCDVVSPGLGDDNRCSTKAVLVKVADVVVAMGMA
jgi:hypothetical protein